MAGRNNSSGFQPTNGSGSQGNNHLMSVPARPDNPFRTLLNTLKEKNVRDVGVDDTPLDPQPSLLRSNNAYNQIPVNENSPCPNPRVQPNDFNHHSVSAPGMLHYPPVQQTTPTTPRPILPGPTPVRRTAVVPMALPSFTQPQPFTTPLAHLPEFAHHQSLQIRPGGRPYLPPARMGMPFQNNETPQPPQQTNRGMPDAHRNPLSSLHPTPSQSHPTQAQPSQVDPHKLQPQVPPGSERPQTHQHSNQQLPPQSRQQVSPRHLGGASQQQLPNFLDCQVPSGLEQANVSPSSVISSRGGSSQPIRLSPNREDKQPEKPDLPLSYILEGLGGIMDILKPPAPTVKQTSQFVPETGSHDKQNQPSISSTESAYQIACEVSGNKEIVSEIKEEVIEIGEDDDNECVLMSVNDSKKIFTLNKSLNGLVVNLLDGDEDLDEVVNEIKVECVDTDDVVQENESSKSLITEKESDHCRTVVPSENDVVETGVDGSSGVISNTNSHTPDCSVSMETESQKATSSSTEGASDSHYKQASKDSTGHRPAETASFLNIQPLPEVNDSSNPAFINMLSALGGLLGSLDKRSEKKEPVINEMKEDKVLSAAEKITGETPSILDIGQGTVTDGQTDELEHSKNISVEDDFAIEMENEDITDSVQMDISVTQVDQSAGSGGSELNPTSNNLAAGKKPLQHSKHLYCSEDIEDSDKDSLNNCDKQLDLTSDSPAWKALKILLNKTLGKKAAEAPVESEIKVVKARNELTGDVSSSYLDPAENVHSSSAQTIVYSPSELAVTSSTSDLANQNHGRIPGSQIVDKSPSNIASHKPIPLTKSGQPRQKPGPKPRAKDSLKSPETTQTSHQRPRRKPGPKSRKKPGPMPAIRSRRTSSQNKQDVSSANFETAPISWKTCLQRKTPLQRLNTEDDTINDPPTKKPCPASFKNRDEKSVQPSGYFQKNEDLTKSCSVDIMNKGQIVKHPAITETRSSPKHTTPPPWISPVMPTVEKTVGTKNTEAVISVTPLRAASVEEPKSDTAHTNSKDSSEDSDSSDSDEEDQGNSLGDSESSEEDADVEYRCKLCSKLFQRKSHLKKHMKTHYGGGDSAKAHKKCACKACRRKFHDRTGLQAHLLRRRYCFFDCTRVFWRSKSSESTGMCRMCGKGVAKSKDLKKHCYKSLTCRLRYIDLVLENIKHSKSHTDNASPESKSSKESAAKDQEVNMVSETCPKKDANTVSIAAPPPLVRETEDTSTSSNVFQNAPKKLANIYLCQSCHISYDSPITFRNHCNANESCKTFNLNPRNNCQISMNYCSNCEICMSSNHKLLNHSCSGKEAVVKCKSCSNSFSNTFSLAKHLQMSVCGQQNKTEETVASHPYWKQKIENAKDNESTHSSSSRPVISKDNKLNACLLCSAVFGQISDLLEHSHYHTLEGSYQCPSCQMTFNRYNGLVSHTIWHRRKSDLTNQGNHTSQQDQKIGRPLQEKKPTYTCSVCGAKFDTLKVLESHQVTHKASTHEPEQYYCSLCQLTYTSKVGFDTHMLRHQAKHKNDFWTATVGVNRKHPQGNVKTELNDTFFSCSICGQQFPTLNGRNEHFEICRDSESHLNLAVENEQAGSLKKSRKNSAKRKSNSASSFSHCSLCSSNLRKASFKRHLKIHLRNTVQAIKEKAKASHKTSIDFGCPICKKTFSGLKSLVLHFRAHKPVHIMMKCNKKTGIKPVSQRTNATGEKTARGSQARERTLLDRPMIKRKIATVSYNFSCKQCNKKFYNISSFKLHLKIVHKQNPTEGWSASLDYLQNDSDVKKEIKSPEQRKSSCQQQHLPTATKARPTVTCEVCKHVIQKCYLAKHMHKIHGLPRSLFLVRPKKTPDSSSSSAKKPTAEEEGPVPPGKNTTPSRCYVLTSSAHPRIEVDNGGADIVISNEASRLQPETFYKECGICFMHFTSKGNFWRHHFKHITPCSVRVTRLESVIIAMDVKVNE